MIDSYYWGASTVGNSAQTVDLILGEPSSSNPAPTTAQGRQITSPKIYRSFKLIVVPSGGVGSANIEVELNRGGDNLGSISFDNEDNGAQEAEFTALISKGDRFKVRAIVGGAVTTGAAIFCQLDANTEGFVEGGSEQDFYAP